MANPAINGIWNSSFTMFMKPTSNKKPLPNSKGKPVIFLFAQNDMYRERRQGLSVVCTQRGLFSHMKTQFKDNTLYKKEGCLS